MNDINKTGKKNSSEGLPIGMCIGIAIGTAIGAATHIIGMPEVRHLRKELPPAYLHPGKAGRVCCPVRNGTAARLRAAVHELTRINRTERQ